ncbi:glycerate kinase, partial [bacterium]|nr:glycerate kinase [bacterium]
DVDNPLCGPQGSARVFSPQKGASAQQVEVIEKINVEFAQETERACGVKVAQMPRTGSAGGLAAALHAYVGAELVSGSEFVLKASEFEELLNEHDCLLVGEGKTDAQTLFGKVPWAAIQIAEKLGKKSILISGSLGEGHEKIKALGLVIKIACGRKPSPEVALLQGLSQALALLEEKYRQK